MRADGRACGAVRRSNALQNSRYCRDKHGIRLRPDGAPARRLAENCARLRVRARARVRARVENEYVYECGNEYEYENGNNVVIPAQAGTQGAAPR